MKVKASTIGTASKGSPAPLPKPSAIRKRSQSSALLYDVRKARPQRPSQSKRDFPTAEPRSLSAMCNEWHLLYCRESLASSFSFRAINFSCRHHWRASALVVPARAAESQASNFWVSVSSVDELDLVHEASLQRRECSLASLA